MSSNSARAVSVLWSSRFAFQLGVAGAAVGLGSIWRFPYLAGTGGGSAFILVFVLACVLIATPLLAAECAIGRIARRSPPEATGVMATQAGRSTRWNAIGIIGTVSAFLVFSYYTVIAGFVLAYTWKCAAGVLERAGRADVSGVWDRLLASPLELGAWHLAFVALGILVSARGLNRGIERADRIRAPGLLLLLGVLAAYSLATGDVRRGLAFAFTPDFSAINAQVVLAAVGQAFFATGVGQAMMLVYGSYAERGTSLIRTALVISGSILLVSLLATVTVFPLVFAYGLNPAQGFELVFEVLPRAFIEMPGGRLIGSLFFLLLVLAALMPSIALIEPAIAWLQQRRGMRRATAVYLVAGTGWALGIGSVLSFNLWASGRPLAFVPALADKTFFDALDYVCSNVLMPASALLTSLFVGWRANALFAAEGLAESAPFARRASLWLLRYLCPVAIIAVFLATFL
jgi:NSS family neurotransmitter:Na+ symporter